MRRVGGSSGNEQLTAIVAAVLVPLLLAEAATLLNVRSLVLRGPPQILIRAVVAPVLVASTVVLFGTGVALLALDQTEGTLVGLHKASFVVWAGAFGLHFLTRIGLLWRALRRRVPGISLRLVAAASSVVAGVALATFTLPAMDHLQDHVSGQFGFDDR